MLWWWIFNLSASGLKEDSLGSLVIWKTMFLVEEHFTHVEHLDVLKLPRGVQISLFFFFFERMTEFI